MIVESSCNCFVYGEPLSAYVVNSEYDGTEDPVAGQSQPYADEFESQYFAEYITQTYAENPHGTDGDDHGIAHIAVDAL